MISGVVVEGDHRGRTLGFPTANLAPDVEEELPEDGVYAGTVTRANGSIHVAAISIGRRPTYYGQDAQRLLEAHLLDFDDDLYGEHIAVMVGSTIRGQQAFASTEALIAQIESDLSAVRHVMGSSPTN